LPAHWKAGENGESEGFTARKEENCKGKNLGAEWKRGREKHEMHKVLGMLRSKGSRK